MEKIPGDNGVDLKFGGSQEHITGTIGGKTVDMGIERGGFGPNPEKYYATVDGEKLSEMEAESLFNQYKPMVAAQPWEPTKLD